MLSKLAVSFIVAATIVSAMPGDTPVGGSEAKCNVGTLQCCQDVQKPGSEAAEKQLGVLNVAVGEVSGLLGFKCNPISVLGGLGTGSNCNANPVCCKKNIQNGLVAVGCTPANVNV